MFQILFGLCLFSVCNSYAQDSISAAAKTRDVVIEDLMQQALSKGPIPKTNKNEKQRKWLVGGVSAAVYGGSLISLNKAWYQQYPKSALHSFNDAGEWLQVDKVGHGWSVYNTARATTAAWKWAGLNKKKAVWIGSATGFTYLTVIEILDARSAQWGWSWADMGANLLGSALFAGQELVWNEQRIQYKFSSHKKKYDNNLQQRADALYGASLPERILKDYNGQTYWASINVKSFFKESNLPAWLNVAIGYGGDGLWGGFENKAYDSDGNVVFDRSDIRRQRQWYLSPDIDFTKIKTNSKFIKTMFFALNAIKVPAPALRYSNGKWKGHLLYF